MSPLARTSPIVPSPPAPPRSPFPPQLLASGRTVVAGVRSSAKARQVLLGAAEGPSPGMGLAEGYQPGGRPGVLFLEEVGATEWPRTNTNCCTSVAVQGRLGFGGNGGVGAGSGSAGSTSGRVGPHDGDGRPRLFRCCVGI